MAACRLLNLVQPAVEPQDTPTPKTLS